MNAMQQIAATLEAHAESRTSQGLRKARNRRYWERLRDKLLQQRKLCRKIRRLEVLAQVFTNATGAPHANH